jgi:hypothetical protein
LEAVIYFPSENSSAAENQQGRLEYLMELDPEARAVVETVLAFKHRRLLEAMHDKAGKFMFTGGKDESLLEGTNALADRLVVVELAATMIEQRTGSRLHIGRIEEISEPSETIRRTLE